MYSSFKKWVEGSPQKILEFFSEKIMEIGVDGGVDVGEMWVREVWMGVVTGNIQLRGGVNVLRLDSEIAN